MNSRRLWNLHQRHKFLRAKAPRDILKFRALEMAFPGLFNSYFPPHHVVSSEYTQDRREQYHRHVPGVPRHHDQFECFTDLNLFKNGFNVNQNWETHALQFYLVVPIFCQQFGRRRWK